MRNTDKTSPWDAHRRNSGPDNATTAYTWNLAAVLAVSTEQIWKAVSDTSSQYGEAYVRTLLMKYP